MTKRVIEIDDALFDRAVEVLGAKSPTEIVNLSLQELVAAALRRRHAQRLSNREGLDLDNPEVMHRAWH